MVKINTDECIGCGVCVNICPQAFSLENNVAHLKDETADCIKQAADSCPTQAIIIEEIKQDESQRPSQPTSSFTGRGSGRGMGMGSGRGAGGGMFSGGGRGRNQGKGQGQGGTCVCPKCGFSVAHQRGVPCYQIKCPECGAVMTRN